MELVEAIKTLLYKKDSSKNRLLTSYGENLDVKNVLNEYPRPQLKRESFINLNGYWKYAITKSKDIPTKFDGRILVPFSPESILSGVERQLKPREYLYYERVVYISEIKENNRLILHFGAVDQKCVVWWNGKCVKKHTGGYLPFEVDVTKYLKNKNVLTVRVIDSSDTSYHARGKQKLNSSGMFYTAQSGIWQTVWCEWVPNNYIKELKITPNLDKKSVKIYINTTYPIIKKINISALGIQIKEVHTSENCIEINLDDCVSVCEWTPENPFLYTLLITAGEDRITSYFAMRKFSVGNDNGKPCLCLNNKPYYMHGILDQGYYSDGLMTPPSYDIIKDDIDAMKKLGFNMVRKHIKIEPLVYYHICDVKGMIVWQDMVNGGDEYNIFLLTILPTIFPVIRKLLNDKKYQLFARNNYKSRREWVLECKKTIKLLYNTPSIGMWVLFNEGWGQFDSNKITTLVKEWDNTRIVNSASGWVDKGCSDVKSNHTYFEKVKVKLDNRPFVCDEYGGYTCYIKGHSFSNGIYGYKNYSSIKQYKKAYYDLQEYIETLKEKGLCADVYTQLSDVEDEVNGILTYDRKVNKLV